MSRTSPQDPALAKAIQDALEPVAVLEERLASLEDGPADSSVARRDAGRATGQLCWIFAIAAVQTAIDHLRTWRHVHYARMQPPFAHWTLLRGAVEGAATARWLCDMSLTDERRISRGVGVQLADLQQRQGFEGRMRRKMATVPPPKVAAERRIQELLDDASRDGVSTEKLPGVIALIAEYPFDSGIDSEVLYRVLSAFAHGKMWGLPILSSVLEEGEVTAVAGVARTRFMAQGWATEFLTRWAVGYVTTAADELIAYST